MFEEGLLLRQKLGPENVFDFSLGNPHVRPRSSLIPLEDVVRPELLPASMGTCRAPATLKRVAMPLSGGRKFKGAPLFELIIYLRRGGRIECDHENDSRSGRRKSLSRSRILSITGFMWTSRGERPPVSPRRRIFTAGPGGDSIGLSLREPGPGFPQFAEQPPGRVYTRKPSADSQKFSWKRRGSTFRAVYLVSDEPYTKSSTTASSSRSWSSAGTASLPIPIPRCLSLPGERIGYLALPFLRSLPN